MEAQQNQVANQVQTMNVNTFKARFGTKLEIFRFLTVEAMVYLPDFRTVTIWHLKDLTSGDKTAVFCDDVKFIAVPQYENLTLDLILDFGLSYPAVESALPIMKEIRKMPRQYICNIIFTLVGEPFSKWVSERCKERNENFTEKHGMEIKLQARIAEAAAASTSINQSRGTGAHLMKVGSKRRRSRATIEQEKVNAQLKQQAIEEKLQLLEKVLVENQQLKSKPVGESNAEQVLSQMLDQGFIQQNADGGYGPGDNYSGSHGH